MRRSWFVTTFNPKCTLGWASIVCMPHDPCNKFKLKFKRIILTIFAYSYLRWLCKVLLSVDAWIASVKFPTLWKNLQEFILITVWKDSPSLLIIFWWWRWRFGTTLEDGRRTGPIWIGVSVSWSWFFRWTEDGGSRQVWQKWFHESSDQLSEL